MTVFDKLIRSCKQEGLWGTGKAVKERVIDDKVAYLIRWLQLQLACDLPTNLPDTIRIGHPTGIVIGANAELGDNILIYQNVTIGNKSKAATNCYPVIEDSVIVYSGAVIVGDVTVGENSKIGGNSVVTNDIPPNSVAVGAPARVVDQK